MYAGDVLSIYIMTYNTRFVIPDEKVRNSTSTFDDKNISCSTPR